MRLTRYAGLSALLSLMLAGGAAAQVTQTVTYEVTAINQLSVSGTPSLTVNTATAGSPPTNATAAATWSITTNQANKKVTAYIDTAMPAGLTLSLNMTAPTGATSANAVNLSTVAQNMVTAINTQNQAGIAMTYTLSATSAAGVVASATKTVTFTIADMP